MDVNHHDLATVPDSDEWDEDDGDITDAVDLSGAAHVAAIVGAVVITILVGVVWRVCR